MRHQGVHKNSFRNARAFQNRIGNFEDRGKPEYPKKYLPEQGREPTTNNPQMAPGPGIEPGIRW